MSWTSVTNAVYTQRRYALVFLTLALGISLSIFAFNAVWSSERHEVLEHFELTARDRALALESSVDANVEALQHIRSFYQASDEVRRDEFRSFIAHELAEHPGIQALEWIPRVLATQRTIYEEAARKDGFPEFRILERAAQGLMTPAGIREEYFPVYYVEPYEGNEAALGFDLASNPIRLEALNKSRDTGQSVATARITLVQESGGQFGFLVFQPIYRNGFPAETVAQRRDNLVGFGLGVFRVNDMLEHSLERTNAETSGADLGVQLYDRSGPVEQQLLFTTQPDNGGEEQAPSHLRYTKTFYVAGRTWELILISPAATLSIRSIWEPWAALAGGLLITFLVSGYVMAAMRRTVAVERLVAARTVELFQSNQLLEHQIGERMRTEEALRRSNDQNRGLLDAIPDLMFRINRDGVFLDYKAEKDEDLYAPLETFMGKRLNEVLSPDIAETCIGYVHEALKTGQVQAFEYQLPVGEEMRGFEARAAVSGEDEVLVIVRDITERLAVDRMKEEFVSVVSHELRTPLTSIRGSLGLIAGGVTGLLPEKARHMVDIAVSNTDRLIRLINDILDIERMESGRVAMDKSTCDAGALIVQAAEVMGNMAESAGVSLSVKSESIMILADPDRIVQTLTNLLSNAIKFSPRGSTISIWTQLQGDRVLFQIKDQGRGIPGENLDSIFERFQQVDASDSREKGGTGLGLAICRSIIQQHEGRIWAESAPGEGSTFFIDMPTLPTEEKTLLVSGETGPLVLVCDDDPSILEVVGTLLDHRGYRTLRVGNAQIALEQAVNQRPSAILLDLIMPDMDGWKTLSALKENPETKHIPIVILSVLSPNEAEMSAADVSGWVQKPLNEDKLIDILDRITSRSSGASKVLLVEDDLEFVSLLTNKFRDAGIGVFHVQTGQEAIQASNSILPDLIFLGLNLPEDEGLTIVDWLRRHDRLGQVPLVVYTIKHLGESQRERLTLGRTEFLTKGEVGVEEIAQRVANLLMEVVAHEPATEGARVTGGLA